MKALRNPLGAFSFEALPPFWLQGFFIGKMKCQKDRNDRPCSFPECPKLTEGRFCEEHAKAEARRYEKYQRDPQARKRYGKAWTAIRKAYASEHPFCEVCLAEGRYTPTEAIHHIKPLSQGGTHDISNLKAVCKACHARIHGEIGDRWSRKVKDYDRK